MRGRRFLRRGARCRNVALCFVAGLSLASVVVSFWLHVRAPRIVGRPMRVMSLRVGNESDRFLSTVRSSAEFAFRSYFDRCTGSDEVRTEGGECLDTFGFQSTLIESVETLKLLGMEELAGQAVNQIKASFRCRELGWVNRHELWSRCIAALIGSYLVTGEPLFLNEAEVCADGAIRAGSESAFVNMKTGEARPKMWIGAADAGDAAAGLPELVALYKITGKEKYYSEYRRMITKLPRDVQPSALTLTFYRNLATVVELCNCPFARALLDKHQHDFDGTPWPSYFVMLDAASHFPNLSSLSDAALASYSKDCSQRMSLEFDGSALIGLLRQAPNASSTIQNCINQSLRLRRQYGFTGTALGSFTGTQHTAFLSEWLKIAALLNPALQPLAESSVFNEHSHILHLCK